MIHRILASLGFSLAALLVAAAAGAPWREDPPAELPPISHDVPMHRQQTQVWCWVAAAKMVADYYGRKTPSQCEMLRQQYGEPCCTYPRACRRGGKIAEIRTLLSRFGGKASAAAPPTDLYAFYIALKKGPMILHTRHGTGHFVVATGLQILPSPRGPLGLVAINDPFFGRYEVTFPRLLQVWDAAVVVE